MNELMREFGIIMQGVISMEPICEKDFLESVEKAAFEGAKAGAKEGSKTSIVAKVLASG